MRRRFRACCQIRWSILWRRSLGLDIFRKFTCKEWRARKGLIVGQEGRDCYGGRLRSYCDGIEGLGVGDAWRYTETEFGGDICSGFSARALLIDDTKMRIYKLPSSIRRLCYASNECHGYHLHIPIV